MRHIILKVAYHFCYLSEFTVEKSLLQKILFNSIKMLCVILLSIECIFRKFFCRIEPLPDEKNLPIVSLTSFPARINGAWYVIDSIFNQTIRPKRIIMVLSKEEFPKGIKSVPGSLKRYMDKGLEIMFVDENLRPHKKYFYTLALFENDDIITIDDDVYYWPDTIERLYVIKKNNPGCICANRAYQVVYRSGCVQFLKPQEDVGITLSAQGVGGVLYIKEFRSRELFNKDVIDRFCINCDDNWLKVQQMLCGLKVAKGSAYPHPLPIVKSQKRALYYDNIYKGESIQVSKSLIEYYNLGELFHNQSA